MSEWQPIETAPKDGTEILAWRDDAGVMLVRYTSMDAFLTETELSRHGYRADDEAVAEEDWFYSDFVHGGRLAGDETPTHWMPLPEPPK
jgi:hypothetical protein